MRYDRSAHCVHCHRFHIVRATRYRHRVRRGFPEIRGRYWGRRFWGRGYFPATTGAITDGPVLQYPGRRLPDATGASRLHSRHRSGDKSRGGCGTERLQSRSQHELG